MELTDIELSVLNRLFKATRGLYMRTIQTQYNLTAAVFFDLISGLKSKGHVRTEEDRVQITSQGIEYLVGHPKRNETLASSDSMLTENFQGKKIGINEFYIQTKFEK